MRLDLALVERGLARSRSHARQLIDSRRVCVNGLTNLKVASTVTPDSLIEVELDPYVSRGAHKLLAVLDQSDLVIPARVLDAGASTGGFTQVLLERGAQIVYAVDVGHGQLAETLRSDQRVIVHEGVNLRDLDLSHVGGQPVDLVVADVSFISLQLILDRLFAVLSPTGAALVLVKPQFEVGPAKLVNGLVRRETDRLAAVDAVVAHGRRLGWVEIWRRDSAISGQKGNQETFCLFAPSPRRR
ncbi:MAG: TlyA family RNA methyltransferase [Propionibacteriaceae bacterium]|nr:TlyA family RNA methyltransferase [Propionibacteriaceae bacterium]